MLLKIVSLKASFSVIMSKIREINVDDIDDKTKNLVNGFIRNIDESMDQIIPDSIIFIVFAFYYLDEYFKTFDTAHYQCDDNRTIECIDDANEHSVYGNISIQAMETKKCLWSFKIYKCTKYIYFGISSTFDVNKRFYYGIYSSNYCLQLDGYKWTKTRADRYTRQEFCDGDIVSMEVDFKAKEIKYSRNGVGLGVVFSDIDVTKDLVYKMAIRLADVGNKVELIDFQRE